MSELPQRSNPVKSLGWLGLLLAVTALAYLPSLSGDFVWDDRPLIVDDDSIHTLSEPWRHFTHLFWSSPLAAQARSFYRPLVTLSYAIDWSWSGGNPFSFRVVNLLLHLMCGLLLHGVARAWGAEGTRALAAAALYLLLPRATECVAWISGRTDLFALCFGLLAMLVWRRGHFALAALSLLASLLCKEVGIVFWIPLLADWRRATPRPGRAPWALGASLTAYLLLRVIASRLDMEPDLASHSIGLGAPLRALALLESWGRYAWMLMTPWSPTLQAGTLGAPTTPFVALGSLLLLTLAIQGFRTPRAALLSPPLPLSLVVAALGALGLVSHVVPLAVNVVAADRYLLVPTALLLLAWTTHSPLALSRGALLGGGAAVALLAAQTSERALDWSNELTLWSRATETRSAANFLPLAGLSSSLVELSRCGEALSAADLANRVKRSEFERHGLEGMQSPTLAANEALCLGRGGNHEEAARRYLELARNFPEKRLYALNAALSLARAGRWDAALELAAQQSSSGSDRARAAATALQTRLLASRARESTSPAGTAEYARWRAELGDVVGALDGWARAAPSGESLREAARYRVLWAPREEAEKALTLLAGAEAETAAAELQHRFPIGAGEEEIAALLKRDPANALP